MTDPAIENWQAWKRRTLIGFVFLSVALGIAIPFLSKGSWGYAALRFFVAVALSVLSLLWCIADGGVKNLRLGRVVLTTVILVPYVGVPIYVFQRRGLKDGAVMITKIIGFVLLLLAVFGTTREAVMTVLTS